MRQESEPTRILELEPRLLFLFLIIAIPFTLIGSVFILGSARAELNQVIGRNLSEVAADTAQYLDSYLLHNVTSVSVLAVTPPLTEAVAAANRRYPADYDLGQAQLMKLDREWQGRQGKTALAEQILKGSVSAFLREVEVFNPAYKEILLTDQRGALVAATNPSTDYYQADERWWLEAFGDGENGLIFVSGVHFDKSAQAYAMEVVVPIRERFADGRTSVAGILKALIDAGDLFSVIGGVKVGESGRSLLIDASDGTVITGEDPKEVMQKKYPSFTQLQQASAEGRSFFVGQGRDNRARLVGLASFSIGAVLRRLPGPRPYPELDWFVTVEQLLDEAQAPIHTATKYQMIFFGGMILTVLFFSLYLHFKLVRPIREIDLREEMERLSPRDTRAAS